MPTIAAAAWSLREATDADQQFLRSVFADACAAGFSATGLPATVGEQFLELQFRAREHSWARYAHVRSSIVLVDGAPGGRLLVGQDSQGLHLVDIALMAQHRGHGIGTAVLAGLATEADERHLPIILYVEWANPARRLYERAGFVEVDHDAFRVRMRREPCPARERT